MLVVLRSFCWRSEMGNKHFLLARRISMKPEQSWERPIGDGPPYVEKSQHLQVDDGFRDALDAVVVKVQWLEGGEETHLRGDLCEAILGQICKPQRREEDPVEPVHFERPLHVFRSALAPAHHVCFRYEIRINDGTLDINTGIRLQPKLFVCYWKAYVSQYFQYWSE